MKKKTITLILAAAMMVTNLLGCGSSDTDKEAAGTGDTAESQESDQTEEPAADDTADEADETTDSNTADTADETEIQVFIAASLNTVMTQIAEEYNKENPNVKIVYNADSSGTLLTQIQEGYECEKDITFRSRKDMNVISFSQQPKNKWIP